MKKSMKLLSLLLALVMVLGLAACGGSKTETPKTETKTETKTESSGGSTTEIRDVTTDKEKEEVVQDENANETRTLNISLANDCGTLNPMNSQGAFVNVTYAFYEPLWVFELPEDSPIMKGACEALKKMELI